MDGVYRGALEVKRAPGKSSLYRKQGHLLVEAYSDGCYAGDKADRKSHGGYATYVGGQSRHLEITKTIGGLSLYY